MPPTMENIPAKRLHEEYFKIMEADRKEMREERKFH